MRRVLILLSAVVVGMAWADEGDLDAFVRDGHILTRHPHRLAGTAAGSNAVHHIRERLLDVGVDEVIVQPFQAVQTRVHRCEMVIEGGGDVFPLQPCRPNGILPPVSPPGGIRGPLLHAGDGSLGSYGERSPQGAIVVLDYAARRNWLRAFRLGASAVIFTRRGANEAQHTHSVEADANLPRFYYEGAPEALPDGESVVLHSKVTWEPVRAQNVFGFIWGTDPLFQMEREEMVVLGARLDSFGEVPRRAPGARTAANCAGLLRVAEHLCRDRPRRNVLVAFFDNEARGHAGSAAFYRALEDSHHAAVVAARAASVSNETAFLQSLQGAVSAEEPHTVADPMHNRLQERLKEKAAERAYAIRAQLVDLRESRYRLQMGKADSKAAEDRLAARIEEGEQQKDLWNEVRRYLAKFDAAPPPELKPLLQRLAKQVERDIVLRRAELALEQENVDVDRRLVELLGDQYAVLHLSLLLGDAVARSGLLIGGDSDWRSAGDQPGLYGKIQSTVLSAVRDARAAGLRTDAFESGTLDGSITPARMLSPAPRLTHAGEIAGRYGVFNAALVTAQDALPREGTPGDTWDALNAETLREQFHAAAVLLRHLLDREGLSLRRPIARDRTYVTSYIEQGGDRKGPLAMARTRGSAMPNKRMPGVIVRVSAAPRFGGPGQSLSRIPGFDNFQVLRSNQNGNYSYGPVPVDTARMLVNGFGAKFDEEGRVQYASTSLSSFRIHSRITLVECHAGVVALPPQVSPGSTKVMDAASSAPLSEERSYVNTLEGITYWYCEPKVEAVKLFGLQSVVALGNRAAPGLGDDEDLSAQGKGYLVGNFPADSTAAISAADLWRLDEERIGILRARGVMNNSVEELHGRAQDLAQDAGETENVAEAEAMAASSFLMQRRVYDAVRGTLDDLVRAVLVLLALSVPFAFVLERLIVGATTIYRRLLGFCAFFIATFLLLFMTHPAFAISATPVIIFLGFAIVVLSSLVIAVIMGKFESELKVLQGMRSTVHAVDVSRLSTTVASMNMGTSTMRRRPLRTTLTAATIVLLTFTILCFASFGTRIGVVRFFVGLAPKYTGVFVHSANWSRLPESVVELTAGRWGDAGVVARRYWLSPEGSLGKGVIVSRSDGSRLVSMRGVLGLDSAEVAHRADLNALLGNPSTNLGERVWVTSAVGERLGVEPGDMLLVQGHRLEVGTFLDPSRLVVTRDMDESSILPVDFSAMTSFQGEEELVVEASVVDTKQNWAYLPADSVLIVDAELARRMGAVLRAVTLYTDDVQAAEDMAESLSRVTSMPVAATLHDGVYRHVMGKVVEASGFGDLFFPLLLGGLVIFGTMLGSVADREKEIYTFSALGLAPPHVASLFFAEALVFSVLGGLGGYLVAQASIKVLQYLAGYGWVRVPELNYSSMNAIMTILVVMVVVLISSIFPAIKASRSANPGLLRTWRLPEPDGDVLSLVFPFTVSSYDITGIVSFLREHFNNYSDSGLGTFIARDTHLTPASEGDADVGLKAHLALAPFDLGVTQSFHLHSKPSAIEGIDEVRIVMQRTSGQPSDWKRLNKVLLDDLRKQFLIWRSLSRETMETYREQTLTEMGNASNGR